MLDETEIKALKASIKHWNKDIIAKLATGSVIKKSTCRLYWEDGILVKCYENDCPLCLIFTCEDKGFDDDKPICPLPYYNHYFTCENPNSEWSKFHSNPCLETAKNMVKLMHKILKENT